MHRKRRLNELELDDLWQRSVFDRLLEPVLRQSAYRNQIVFADIKNPVAAMMQRLAHVDAIVQLPDGTMSLEIKLVRYPRYPDGTPSFNHWRDFFLETWSCTVPGHESRGWLITSQADYLLWGQVSLNEDSVNCWPIPFARLRRWVGRHKRELPERQVPNRINDRELWTRGRLAPIAKVCRDCRIDGFRVDQGGLICDLWGKPLLHFMRGAA